MHVHKHIRSDRLGGAPTTTKICALRLFMEMVHRSFALSIDRLLIRLSEPREQAMSICSMHVVYAAHGATSTWHVCSHMPEYVVVYRTRLSYNDSSKREV